MPGAPGHDISPPAMNFRFLIAACVAPFALATESALDLPAEEANPAELESEISPAAAAALDIAKQQLDRLADMLSAVVDARSASTLAPHICAAYESLRNIDFAAFAEDDEELVAAEFAEDMFLRLDAELDRLTEAAFFNNARLATLFAEADSPASLPDAPITPIPATGDTPTPEAGTESFIP